MTSKFQPISSTSLTALFLMALAGLIFCSIGLGETQDPLKEEILTGIEKQYSHKGFGANFSQTARLSALDTTEKATGKAWFSHPGKMRWLYLTPDRHEIITNGKKLWIYRPDENQVMQGSAESFFSSGGGGTFLSDITQIRKTFDIGIGKVTDTHAELVLTPKKASQDIKTILIMVARPSHEIQVILTENAYGDTTRFIFTNIQFDMPEPAMFEFIIPEGTSMIEMD